MKEIIILGTGASCRFCDFKSEVWGVNGAYTLINVMPPEHKDKFHIEKLFMTDTLFGTEGHLNFNIGSINQLIKDYKCELISKRHMSIGKHKLDCTIYPYKKITDKFDNNYFTDTITYMIAYALDKHTSMAKNRYGVVRLELRKPLKLRLFGVDMCTTAEYQVSKGGVEFWLGQAMALGCEVTVSPGSTIMANPWGQPYGEKREYDLKLVDPDRLLEGNKNVQEHRRSE